MFLDEAAYSVWRLRSCGLRVMTVKLEAAEPRGRNPRGSLCCSRYSTCGSRFAAVPMSVSRGRSGHQTPTQRSLPPPPPRRGRARDRASRAGSSRSTSTIRAQGAAVTRVDPVGRWRAGLALAGDDGMWLVPRIVAPHELEVAVQVRGDPPPSPPTTPEDDLFGDDKSAR